MKILSLFSGIGAFEKALKKLDVNYDLVSYCEIDKYASKSYAAIHNVDENMNLGDITKVDTSALPSDIDLITYGFPCQDISIAGKQKGLLNDDGTKTRSGLFFEALRIIEDTKPKVAMAENVKNLTGKKFKEQFDIVLNSLEQAGYNNYWTVLNAKDYGIPQNRERVFIVSIRKDVDDGSFKFPNGFPLKLRLIDLLDEEVDEKYYVKSKRIDIIQKNLGDVFKDNFIIGSSQKNAFVGDETICPSLTSAMGSGGGQTPMIRTIEIPQTVKVRKYEVDTNKLCEVLRNHKAKSRLTNKYIAEKLNLSLTKVEHWFRQDDCFAIPDENIWLDLKLLLNIETNEFDESIMTFEERDGVYEKSERHYFSDGIAPTLTSTSAGNEKIITKPVLVGGIGERNFGSQYRQGNRIYDSNAVAAALCASPVGNAGGNSYLYQVDDFKIRKLTPKECFRLMGFDDDDYENAAKVNSNAQLYKQAGNSIVVDVLENIFKELKKYWN